MSEQILMAIVAAVIPLSTLIVGAWMYFFTPENRNFGYHTPMSQKNILTWEFANKYAGRLLFICSLVLIPVSLFVILLLPDGTEDSLNTVSVILCCAQCAVFLTCAAATEIALHRHFDKNGNPR